METPKPTMPPAIEGRRSQVTLSRLFLYIRIPYIAAASTTSMPTHRSLASPLRPLTPSLKLPSVPRPSNFAHSPHPIPLTKLTHAKNQLMSMALESRTMQIDVLKR
ncbi:hypothetical protein FRB94_004660 [Tulasnella sp. JGI-2019a]|nr:hypothetical protein FRB93_013463 [Tulasnella sp. JGI-2019a]KAG9001569.1 hypothetical protein FRB94_004660 [Tulasnella sp. JGI-2019a]